MIDYNFIFDKFPVVTTDRLILRAYVVADQPTLFKMYQDKDVAREFIGEGMFMTFNDALINITTTYPDSFLNRKDISWAVSLKSTGEVIGQRDLFIDHPEEPVLTQGFIRLEYRNKGYNQEVLKGIIEFLRNAKAEMLMFNCGLDNEVVLHLAKKMGFRSVFPKQVAQMTGRQKFALSIN